MIPAFREVNMVKYLWQSPYIRRIVWAMTHCGKWTKKKIENELKKYPEWYHTFDLGYGIKTQGIWRATEGMEERKHNVLYPVLDLCGGSFKGKTILDIGCNEGFWSFEALRHGADCVVGIDGRSIFVQKANFLRNVYGFHNVEFKHLTAYQISKELGDFDIVFFFGVLYHLSEPVNVLRRIHSITRELLVVDTGVDRYRPYWDNILVTYREFDPRPGSDKMGAVDEEIVLIPTLTSLYDMLEASGFVNARFVEPSGDMSDLYRRGHHVTVIAEIQKKGHYFNTLSPRYYRPQDYRLLTNITIGKPWDAPSVNPPLLYWGRNWIIQRSANYGVEFTTKAPVTFDIVLNKERIIFKEEVNGTKLFTTYLEKGQSIEPRIVSENTSDVENVEMIRIMELD